MKRKKCSMEQMHGCGWFYKDKKLRRLRKSKSFRFSGSWLSEFLFRRHHALWEIVYGRTEWVCDHHYLLSNFGLVPTLIDGKEYFCNIEFLIENAEKKDDTDEKSLEFLT